MFNLRKSTHDFSNKKNCLQIFPSLLASTLVFISANATGARLQAPEIIMLDTHRVDMISQSPTFSLDDLSIGSGDLSLSHTIASFGAEFYGYDETFYAGLHKQRIYEGPYDSIGFLTYQADIGLRSIAFRINDDDTYTALREPSNTLEKISDSEFLLTLTDGTEATFTPTKLSEIKYANGLTVTIHYDSWPRVRSVTTNTGLQFKYHYALNNFTQFVPPFCHSYDMECAQEQDAALEYFKTHTQSGEWWKVFFPSHITAINNAVEYCDPLADSCNLQQDWPQVTYHWPEDMPNAYFDTDMVFKVSNPEGRMTEYHHERHDAIHGGSHPGYESYVSRIVAVKDSTSEDPIQTYRYENKIVCNVIGATSMPTAAQYPYDSLYSGLTGVQNASLSISVCSTEVPAVLEEATYGDYKRTYIMGETAGYDGINYTNESFGEDTYRATMDVTYGVPTLVGGPGYNLIRERSHRNRLLQGTYDGVVVDYRYDDRENMTKKIEQPRSGSPLADLVTEASYDANCTNRKTCNQANWIKDPNGNVTNYEYHSASGLVSKMTLPADDNGIRPETRYEYAQRYAWYKNAAGNYQRADSPVWLLMRERFCKSGAASGNSCAIAGDEVITEYEYGPESGPNNLFLRGVVRAADGEVQRTCYQYDRYGNKVAETRPRANLASCP